MTPILEAPDWSPSGATLAMYSSVYGGIVTDPRYMMVPVDDHLVHRGDGVFETVKQAGGRLYLLDPHLVRLRFSAAQIGIELPWTDEALATILVDTVAACGREDVLLRVLVSRGPGGFSVNPYESLAPQLYVMAYPAAPPFMAQVPGGAKVGISEIPVKPSMLATIKTCNYLTNALMKKEAVDRGLHFVVGVDPAGMLAESFTENLCIVDAAGRLIRPGDDYILGGTTMNRCFDLAAGLGIECATRSFSTAELLAASEVLIMGTTAEVTCVVDVEGQAFSPGPVYAALAEALRADMAAGT